MVDAKGGNMAETIALTPGQQSVVRTLTAERIRAVAICEQAINEYLKLLTTSMQLEGDWTFEGTLDNIQLVCKEAPPKEPSE